MYRFLLLVGLLLCFAVAVWAAEGDVWLDPASANISPGEAISFKLYIDSGTQKLGAFQFDIRFDPQVIQVDTTKGTSGVEAGADALGNWFANADNPNGVLHVNGFDVNGKQGTSLHVLTIYFKSIAKGQTDITLENPVLANELGQDIIPNPHGAQVIVSVPQVSLIISKNMMGGGSISLSPGEINCVQQECNFSFDQGQIVTLSLTKNSPLYEVYWGGDCSDCKGDTCNLTLDNDKTCEINFVGHVHTSTALGGKSLDIYATGTQEAILDQVKTFSSLPKGISDPPRGVDFPYGYVSFDIYTTLVESGLATKSEPAQVAIALVLPRDPRINAFYKTDSQGQWHKLGHANNLQIHHTAKNTIISFTLSDNDILDEDPRTGVIRDLGAPGSETSTETVPTLNEWGLILLASLLAAVALFRLRRYPA